MVTKDPKVAQLRHRRRCRLDLRQFVFLVETGRHPADRRSHRLSNPLTSSSIWGSSSRRSENSSERASRSHTASSASRLRARRSTRRSASDRSVKADRRHLGEPKPPRRQHQSPAGNDPPVGVDQDRQDEAKPIEALSELVNLVRRVLAGLSPQRLAVRDSHQLRGPDCAKGRSRFRDARSAAPFSSPARGEAAVQRRPHAWPSDAMI